VLYDLSKKQLSKQYHYDFGLRALKSVLVMAGGLKRQYQDMPEDLVLMRCLRDSNLPKFVFEDVPLFLGLISDLFPGMDCPRVGYEDLKEKAALDLESKGYKCSNERVFADITDKCIQMYETQLVRHTTMIVGPTGGGKSLVLETLRNARLASENVTVKMFVLNPKAQPLNELYGEMDAVTRDWTDGILSKLFRELNGPGKDNEMRWILYDGDVDALWVENMNSVMDDNRLLTLPNGERIRLQPYCAMIVETFDLQYASPATISRCGMVWVDPKNLGYRPFYERWVRTRFGNSVTIEEAKQPMADMFTALFEKYVPKSIDLILAGLVDGEMGQKLKQVIPITNIDMVKQLCSVLDAFLPLDVQDAMEIEMTYIFSVIWSLGAALVGSARIKYDAFVKKISREALPDKDLLYDYYFDPRRTAGSDGPRRCPPMPSLLRSGSSRSWCRPRTRCCTITCSASSRPCAPSSSSERAARQRRRLSKSTFPICPRRASAASTSTFPRARLRPMCRLTSRPTWTSAQAPFTGRPRERSSSSSSTT
jgi:dynein heavy chain